jgi:hypothetical protein
MKISPMPVAGRLITGCLADAANERTWSNLDIGHRPCNFLNRLPQFLVFRHSQRESVIRLGNAGIGQPLKKLSYLVVRDGGLPFKKINRHVPQRSTHLTKPIHRDTEMGAKSTKYVFR